MAEFPELSESEFMKDWGNISFVIQDSDQAFQGKVDEQTFRGVFDGYRPKAPPPRATASASLENKRYWLPLADDEAAKLRSKLRGLTQEPLSIWCNGDNCRDIAETVQAAFQQSNWGDPQIEESIFPLNFVGVHVAPDTEKTRALENAIEEATAGRIIVKVEPEPTNDKMINIMFGRKR
jgi:hypothetical protein